jgi:hypothetical protein
MSIIRFVRHPIVWFGTAISIAALALAFRGLHWGEVGHAIASANYLLLLLALALLVVSFVVRAIRWKTLFAPRTELRSWNVFGALTVGYALNNLLPLRIGELGRAYLICQTEPVDSGQALSTIVLERALDTVTVVLILIVTLPFIDAPSWARGPALLLGAAFLGIIVVLAIAAAARERTLSILRRVTRRLPSGLADRADRLAETALDGFSVIHRPRVMAQAMLWSVVAWLASALVMFMVMRAFGLDVPLSAGLFVMCATSLGGIVPSSPGYVGVFHAIAIESLVNVFGVGRGDAASFAFVQHAMLYVTPIGLSAVYFAGQRGTWQTVLAWVSAADETASTPPAAPGADI